MPRRSRANRHRTTSQSSLEIQLSDLRRRTPPHAAISPQQAPLVLPSADFGQLLKFAGAEGTRTLLGELYTVKQLCFYLKEYIKLKQLFDPDDPRVIHCQHDPLGKVFGVEKFTLEEALEIVKKHTVVIDTPGARWRHTTPPPSTSENSTVTTTSITGVQASESSLGPNSETHRKDATPATQSMDVHRDVPPPMTLAGSVATKSVTCIQENPTADGVQAPQGTQTQGSSSTSTPEQGMGRKDHQKIDNLRKDTNTDLTVDNSACPNNNNNNDKEFNHLEVKSSQVKCQVPLNEESVVAGPSCEKTRGEAERLASTRRKRKRTKSEHPPFATGEGFSRKRHSSFSIVYTSDGGGGREASGGGATPWYLEVALADDSDEETVYSVQSKSTVYVKDSSDDLWFLDSEDENEAEISVEICSTHSAPFAEEYEVESLSSSYHGNQRGHGNDDDDDSDSPVEEIYVVCDESDTQFWADSESSDTDSCSDSDTELSSDDKWLCDNCDTLNTPIMRHCQRCWMLRPGWVSNPQNSASCASASPRRQKSVPSSPKSRICEMRRPVSSDLRRSTLPDVSSVTGKGVDSSIVMNRFLCSTAEPDPTDSKPGAESELTSEARPTPMAECSPLKNLSRADTIPVQELSHSSPLFKIPSTSSEEPSRSYEKGRHLPRLKLPSDDSGFGSLTSSQESSFTGASSFSNKSPAKSPRKNLQSPIRPTSTLSPRVHRMSPRVSPYPRKSTLFSFDRPIPSPRLDEEQSSSKRVLFMDPIPSPKKRAANGVEYTDMCMICMSKPKEASMIHGKTGHQVCCYKCAKQLRRRGKGCPVCRRPIQKVIKNYLV